MKRRLAVWLGVAWAAIGGVLAPTTTAATLLTAEAFFDDPATPEGQGVELNLNDGDGSAFDIARGALDLKGLTPGLHSVYIRFLDDAGEWSSPLAQTFFMKGGAPTTPLPDGASNALLAAEAFVNDDPGEGNGAPVPLADSHGVLDGMALARGAIDLGSIPPGIHLLHLRFRDARGLWSTPLIQPLAIRDSPPGDRSPDPGNPVIAAEAFVGPDPGAGNGVGVALRGGDLVGEPLAIFAGAVTAREFSEGVHTLSIRIQDSSGAWSAPYRRSVLIPAVQQPEGTGTVGAQILVSAAIAVDGGQFEALGADDGAFDGITETVTAAVASTGAFQSIEVRFVDSSGRVGSTAPRALLGNGDDTDWDGLSDSWERLWFGDLSRSGTDDSDGDGFTNTEEFDRGQSPTIAEQGGGLFLSGRVRTPEGAPIANVALCLQGPVSLGCGTPTDALGQFVVTGSNGLPPGAYQLTPVSTPESGPHAFTPSTIAVSLDRANVSGIDFTGTPIADTEAPTTVIVSGPGSGALLATPNATFGWIGQDDRPGLVVFSTRLDAGPWSAFSSAVEQSLVGLTDGVHTFSVRAADAAGNIEPTPAERTFTVDTTPPAPASALTGASSPTGVILRWDASPSIDVARYRVYWDAGTGVIDYGVPLAEVAASVETYVAGIHAAGTYRFGLRAVDAAGNVERNTDVVATVGVVGIALTVSVPGGPLDRGQSVAIEGTAQTVDGAPLPGLRVAVDVSSRSGTRNLVAFTDAAGRFQQVFQPLATEAGEFTIDVSTLFGGVEARAAAGFEILGLYVQPSMVQVELSMSSTQTIGLIVRNLGTTTLSGLRTEFFQETSAGPLTASLDPLAVPTELPAGGSFPLPIMIEAAAGDPPASPATFSLTLLTNEGATETSVITVTGRAAIPVPLIEPAPVQVGMQPGGTTSRVLVVANRGFAELEGTLSVEQPALYPWVALVNAEVEALAPGEEREIRIELSPPSELTLGTYVVPLVFDYGTGTTGLDLVVELTTDQIGIARFRVFDDTGSTVSGADVLLISESPEVLVTPDGTTETFPSFGATTDGAGIAVLSDLPAGEYRYIVSAAGHARSEGMMTVEPGSIPAAIAVALTTQLVQVDFKVVETTIVDEYTVTLDVTYTTNLTKPALLVTPAGIDLGFFPLDPERFRSGQLTIRNTSNNAPVRGVVVDAAALDMEAQEIVVGFGPERLRTLEVGDLGPGESIIVNYVAEIPEPASAQLVSRHLGNISVSGRFTYVFDGLAREGVTSSPVPVVYSKPAELRIPTIQYVRDKRDGVADDLEFVGNSFRFAVESNRSLQFDLIAPPGDALPRLIAPTPEVGIPITPDGVLSTEDPLYARAFNTPGPLVAKGDQITFDVPDLGAVLEQRLAENSPLPSDLMFVGQWADRDPELYFVPISILVIEDNVVRFVSQCRACSTSEGRFPGLRGSARPLNTHGDIRLRIEQTVSLERQAFDIALGLTPSVPELTGVGVALEVTTEGGEEAGNLFSVIESELQGIDALTDGTINGPGSIAWKLIPRHAAALTVEGTRYRVRAHIEYGHEGQRFSHTTLEETITVLPLPELELIYTLPYVVMADKQAPIRVRVRNDGAGPANHLTITSAQPRVVDPETSTPISFIIEGSSSAGDFSKIETGVVEIVFPEIGIGSDRDGVWSLLSSRDGYFVELSATLRHLGVAGVPVDPLITSVQTRHTPALGIRVHQIGCDLPHGFRGRLWTDSARTSLVMDDPVSGGRVYFPELAAARYFFDISTDAGVDALQPRPFDVLEDQVTPIVSVDLDLSEVSLDGDDVQDCWEWRNFQTLDRDLSLDYDDDGLSDLDEYHFGTDPLDVDSDDDLLTDGEEVVLGTDPLDSDSDGDLVPDGEEIADGRDPLDACDRAVEEIVVDVFTEVSVCGDEEAALHLLDPTLVSGDKSYSVRQSLGNEIWVESRPREDLNGSDTAIVSSDSGLYELNLEEELTDGESSAVWRQRIYKRPTLTSMSGARARELALEYAPAVVFHQSEEYFPESLEDILSNPTGEEIRVEMPSIVGPKTVELGRELRQFLQFNGHADGYLDFEHCETACNQDVPGACRCPFGRPGPLFYRTPRGEKEKSVVYYEFAEESDRVYLTYHFFYRFDPKLGTSRNPKFSAHALDRESFTIEFEPGNPGLVAVSVTYGGHLESQEMSYRGCPDEGEAIATWMGGRMQLPWRLAPKYQDGVVSRPIVFLAKGSHAVFPLPGWYEVVDRRGHVPLSLAEPAGLTDGRDVVVPLVRRLDLDDPRYLAFSGFWVDVVGDRFSENVRFPPFTGRAPYAPWVRDSSTPFEPLYDCLDAVGEDASDACARVRPLYQAAEQGFLDTASCE